MDRSPIRGLIEPILNRIEERRLPSVPLPRIPKREVSTPFGKVTLPAFSPPPTRFVFSERVREALAHAVGADLATVFQVIPYVGGFISEQISDLHLYEIRKLLTEEELTRYMRWEKKLPGTTPPLFMSVSKEEE